MVGNITTGVDTMLAVPSSFLFGSNNKATTVHKNNSEKSAAVGLMSKEEV